MIFIKSRNLRWIFFTGLSPHIRVNSKMERHINITGDIVSNINLQFTINQFMRLYNNHTKQIIIVAPGITIKICKSKEFQNDFTKNRTYKTTIYTPKRAPLTLHFIY